MDNLGEAQDVNKGLWPSDKPLGQHPSVLHTLPRMLDLLDQHGAGGGGGIKATYFAESWSLDVYPEAVGALRRRGHEVAWHGYQHEAWRGLSEEEEKANFERSFAKVAGYNHGSGSSSSRDGEGEGDGGGGGGGGDELAYEGFRPPGGEVNGDRTCRLLREHGIRYVSPLGVLGIRGGVVVLPFEWETVDAFWYMAKFAPIRREHGAPEEPLAPEDFREYLFRRIDEVKREGGYVSILFHPFLQTSEERLGVLGEVLARIGGDDEIWCAPCRDVAAWVREHAGQFGFELEA